MVTINNTALKHQLEQFSKLGSEAERKAFWENFSQDFDALDPSEQEDMRQSWLKNMDKVESRLKAIGKQLDTAIGEISIFPSDASEARLIEALLDRMGVRYRVG
ncbi:MAG: hypothetical protein R2830_01060 [Saprospiraceae bacterium]